MKKTLIAAALTDALFAGVTQAANFGGAYVGAQVGAAMAQTKSSERPSCFFQCMESMGTEDTNAYGGVRGGYNWTSGPMLFGVSFLASGNGKSSGYVFGFGADYALSKQLTLGVEYSAYRFKGSQHPVIQNPGSFVDFKTKVDTVGVNINYKF